MRRLVLAPLLVLWFGISSCDSARQEGSAGTGGAPASGGQGGPSAGQGGQSGQSGAPDDVPTIMATYQTWQPLSDAPVDISDRIFGLCRPHTDAENRFVQSAHTRFALRDWANPAAVAGLAVMGAGHYAAGAVIVKEKFVAQTVGGPLELAALGMMIKRSPGFDASGGDWEFVYWNATDGVSRGQAQLPTCTACHAGAVATDFVFRNTAWPSAPSP
jgi:hypothetical protein